MYLVNDFYLKFLAATFFWYEYISLWVIHIWLKKCSGLFHMIKARAVPLRFLSTPTNLKKGLKYECSPPPFTSWYMFSSVLIN